MGKLILTKQDIYIIYNLQLDLWCRKIPSLEPWDMTRCLQLPFLPRCRLLYPPEQGRCLPRQSPHYGGYTKCLAVRLRQCDQTNIVFTPMHYNVPSLLCQTRGSRTAAQVSAESAFQRSYSIINLTFLLHHIYSISALYVHKTIQLIYDSSFKICLQEGHLWEMKLPTPPWLAVRQGQGQGQGYHATDAGALLVHKGCWHLLDIALSCVGRRRAKECSAHDTGTLFTTSCQYGPAWYLQHICLTLKWPICQSFQTHFNTERYYNTFRLYLFAVNMLEGHQPAGGVARYTTSLLRIMLCHMSEITPPTESALLGSYYSYEQIKSLQVGVANVKSAVVCVWHLIKDVVSSHHQQPDTIIADVIRIDKYLPGGGILQK